MQYLKICVLTLVALGASNLLINSRASANDTLKELTCLGCIYKSNITFSDTQRFDKQLAYSLAFAQKEGDDIVTVDVNEPEIPARLGNWSKVARVAGQKIRYCQIKSDESIIPFWGFIKKVISAALKTYRYSQVRNYNIIVEIDSKEKGIKNFLFVHENYDLSKVEANYSSCKDDLE
ncbi:MAG: hypothetical protein AAF066_16285 [Pseudomonadota bacterium]